MAEDLCPVTPRAMLQSVWSPQEPGMPWDTGVSITIHGNTLGSSVPGKEQGKATKAKCRHMEKAERREMQEKRRVNADLQLMVTASSSSD